MKQHSPLLLLFFLPFLLLPPTAANFLPECLAASNIDQILPNSTSYPIASQVFNARFNPTPADVTYPFSAKDVSQIVKCAAQFGFYVVPRSGGHSYEGYSGGRRNAVVVDLEGLNTIVVNNKTGTAQVGAGVRVGALYLAVALQGYGMAMGTCPDVGVGGLTLGGGIGYFSREWGLTVDQVIEMEVVLADGSIVIANENTNADLFWALRGAGSGNFGIVTRFTFRLSKPPSRVITFFYNWNLTDAVAVLSAAQAWSVDPGTPKIGWGLRVSQYGATLLGVYLGSRAEFQPYIESFLSRTPNTTSVDVHETDFVNSVLLLSALVTTNIYDLALPNGRPPRDNFKAKSFFIQASNPLPNEAFELLVQKVAQPPPGSTDAWFQFDIWGGTGSVINRVPTNATAFSHRSSLMSVQFYVDSSDPGTMLSSAGIAWITDLANILVPYLGPTAEAYQNYIDSDLGNWQQAYYGSNYPRLQRIKAKYDPKGVFTVPQGVVTNGKRAKTALALAKTRMV